MSENVVEIPLLEISWHKMTSAEVLGAGYDIVVDIDPSVVPDEAADWNGVLVRTGKNGWGWYARSFDKEKYKDNWREMGVADTKEDAISDAMAAVRRNLEGQ